MSLDMNPEIRAQWCAALRSGDYAQAKDVLRGEDADGNPTGYCCLGVLTDLAVKAGIWDWEKDGDLEEDLLPEPVMEWAGLNRNNPLLWDGTRRTAAATLNDDGDCTFAEIADLIDGGTS